MIGLTTFLLDFSICFYWLTDFLNNLRLRKKQFASFDFILYNYIYVYGLPVWSTVLLPAVIACKGIQLTNIFPADTVFCWDMTGENDT